jgi:hypothetical protein
MLSRGKFTHLKIKMVKPVMIVDNCTQSLSLNESASIKTDKKYVLDGIFTEFGVKNRNERIYTAEKFLPHLNTLLERKKTSGNVIYGEFDHPDVFDTSLKRASHVIEHMEYNKEENRVDGRIRLLSTHYGKEARALVEDACPIFVSSRAAGTTGSDSVVTIKHLFTYDIVADPGFGNARMHMNTINESCGYATDVPFRIYDMSKESDANKIFETNMNDAVTANQLSEYSDYIAKEITGMKEQIKGMSTSNSTSSFNPEKLEKALEYYEALQETSKKMEEYLDYLSEKMSVLFIKNESLEKTTGDLIRHNDYIAEQLDKTIDYSEYIGEQLDKNIDYAEYIGEQLDKTIDYSEYIAEQLDKTIDYSEYIGEQLDKNIDYAEYIAEHLDKSIDYSEYIGEQLDKTIDYSEYVAEQVDKSIDYSEYISEQLDKSIDYSEYVAEQVSNSIDYAEYIIEHVENNIEYSEYVAEQVDYSLGYSALIAENLNSKINESRGGSKIKSLEDFIAEQEELNAEDDYTMETDSEGDTNMYGGSDEDPNMSANDLDLVDGKDGKSGFSSDDKGSDMGDEEFEEGIDGEITVGCLVKLAGTSNVGRVASIDGEEAQITLADDTEIAATLSQLVLLEDSGEESIEESIKTLIMEAKKREASKTNEPHFFSFLTNEQIKSFRSLSDDDQETVIVAMNESDGYFTQTDVLNIMRQSLSAPKETIEEKVLSLMPETVKPAWEGLNESEKRSIMAQARLHNIKNDEQIVGFWETRKLTNSLNESRMKILSDVKLVDPNVIPDDVAAAFIERFKSL